MEAMTSTEDATTISLCFRIECDSANKHGGATAVEASVVVGNIPSQLLTYNELSIEKTAQLQTVICTNYMNVRICNLKRMINNLLLTIVDETGSGPHLWDKLRISLKTCPSGHSRYLFMVNLANKKSAILQPIFSVALQFHIVNADEVTLRSPSSDDVRVVTLDMINRNNELKPLRQSDLRKYITFHRKGTDGNPVEVKPTLPGLKNNRTDSFQLYVYADKDRSDAVDIRIAESAETPCELSSSAKQSDKSASCPSQQPRVQELEIEFHFAMKPGAACDSLRLLYNSRQCQLKPGDQLQPGLFTGRILLDVKKHEKRLVPLFDGVPSSFKQLKFSVESGTSDAERRDFQLEKLDTTEFEKVCLEPIVVHVNLDTLETAILLPHCLIVYFELPADGAGNRASATIATNFGTFELKTVSQNGEPSQSVLSGAGQVTVYHCTGTDGVCSLLARDGDRLRITEIRLSANFAPVNLPDFPIAAKGVRIRVNIASLDGSSISVDELEKCTLVDLIVRSGDCGMQFGERLHVIGNCRELGSMLPSVGNLLKWSSEHGRGVKSLRTSFLVKDGSSAPYYPGVCDAGTASDEEMHFSLMRPDRKLSDVCDQEWILNDCINPKKLGAQDGRKEPAEANQEGQNRMVELTFRIKGCPAADGATSIRLRGNCRELETGEDLHRQSNSNVFSGSVEVEMRKSVGSLIPIHPPEGKLLKFSVISNKGENATIIETSMGRKEWTLPLKVDSFKDDTSKKLKLVVNMTWGEEPIILQQCAINLRISALCEIQLGDYICGMQINSNFPAVEQFKGVKLSRHAQEKRPTRLDPTGLEKWGFDRSVTAYCNSVGLFNIDGEQLSFNNFLLAYRSGLKVTLVVYSKTIRLQSDLARREIHYELKVVNDYKEIDFRPGVQVTLHLAHGPCALVHPPGQSISGKFLLQSEAQDKMELLMTVPYSCKCTCKDSRCSGQETVRASEPATILMYKHSRQLLLAGKRQLYIGFELPTLLSRQSSRQTPTGQQPEAKQAADAPIKLLLECGPAFGNLEYYCQLGDTEPIITSPIKVQLKFVTKYNPSEADTSVCLIGNCPDLRRPECMKRKNDNCDVDLVSQNGQGKGKASRCPAIWVQRVTLNMYQIGEELYLTGKRRLCVRRALRSTAISTSESYPIPDEAQMQEIQLLTHQPGECLQFQIEIFAGNTHRVFPNMPMNQLPKDSILGYFQTALYSALPQLTPKPQFSDVRDIYAKRLVPLIKQNGDYDEADGASRPHEFHDIWGEDPESDLDEEDQETVTEPKSAVKYVQMKRRKNLESSRDFTKEIHKRLNNKYHSREREVWRHLSTAAMTCHVCRDIYANFEYRGIDLCKGPNRLLHDDYLSVLKQITRNVSGSECTCTLDHRLVMTNSAAVVRGRLEAFLVDNTSNMLSDQFYYEWQRHTEASGCWFVLLMAAWAQFKLRSRLGFEDAIREDSRPVPAFFKWRSDAAYEMTMTDQSAGLVSRKHRP